ncbi:MAG: transcription factor S [Candidatus Hermodarchaeota archaeon]
MVEFCPECSNLLRKRIENNHSFLVCKCGYQKELNPNNNEIEINIKKKKKALEKNLLVISEDDKILVHPITKKDCPKCGNLEAETWQVQIRSSDEPATHFFRCTECKNTWRE